MSTTTGWTSDTLGHGSLVAVNGVDLYIETVGTGEPLVLLHGGLGSSEMFAPLVPALAAGRQVVLVDLQGHGRTPDVADRPLDHRTMAGDVAALVEHLGIGPVDVVGYSLGGGVALQLAFRHPQVVKRLVVCSANITRSAIYPDMLAQQLQVSGAAAPFMTETPMYELYQRVAPRPEDFPVLLDKIGALMAGDFDYSDDVRRLSMPTLVMCADADMAPPQHFVEVFSLLGGGERDGGWQREGRPDGGHALAVVPGTTHYDVFLSPLFTANVLAFLDA
ncbi:alpha/beta hydrolase [Angustibacter peucedani]